MQQHELMLRAAWLYHVEGLTQAEIGERLSLTRRRVNELLASALEDGHVRISFSSPLAGNIELEAKLRDRFGLSDAVVVPTPADPRLIHSVIGRGAAFLLDRLISARRPRSIGVGWGSTMRETVRHLNKANEPELEVLSMLGGLTRGLEINTFETVRSFAQVLNARCTYFVAPIYADSSQSRDVIISQSVFQTTFRQIHDVDVSYLTCGDVTPESLLVRYGLPQGIGAEELTAAGAVGDLLGRFLNEVGEPIDHPLNRQVLSPEFDAYQRIPHRIIAAGGTHKRAILLATARAGRATTIVTDAESAKSLLNA